MPKTKSRQGQHSSAKPGQPVTAVFDLDRTITRAGTYTPFLFFVARRHPARLLWVGPLIVAALAYKLGLISRKRLKEYMLSAILRGEIRDRVAGYADAFAADLTSRGVRPGALKAIEEHRAKGHYLVLATASLDLYVERFADRFGFDAVVATRTSWTSMDCLSGKIDGENCFGIEKLRRLKEVLAGQRDGKVIVAYSDSHADLPLLRWADEAFAVNPSRRLGRLAPTEGFVVVDWNRRH